MLCISLAVRVLSIHSISLNMILFNAIMSPLLLLITALRQSVRRLQELEVLANSLSEEVKEKSLALSHSRKTNRCIFLCMLYCLCFMVPDSLPQKLIMIMRGREVYLGILDDWCGINTKLILSLTNKVKVITVNR